MTVLASVLVALLAGAVWALALRRLRARRELIDAPKGASSALRAYTRGRWDTVIDRAPAALATPERLPADDHEAEPWRAALELALGHSLVQRDRYAEAIPHLERGLLLQAARRRSDGAGDAPTASEAKLRHRLGFSLASTGEPDAARREYARVLATPHLDPAIAARVVTALEKLG